MAAAFKPLMPLDEAWSRLHAAVVEHLGQTPRSTDVVDSFDALGRVLAEDVVSTVDVPPVDNSAMDGYAVPSARPCRSRNGSIRFGCVASTRIAWTLCTSS